MNFLVPLPHREDLDIPMPKLGYREAPFPELDDILATQIEPKMEPFLQRAGTMEELDGRPLAMNEPRTPQALLHVFPK